MDLDFLSSKNCAGHIPSWEGQGWVSPVFNPPRPLGTPPRRGWLISSSADVASQKSCLFRLPLLNP
jgi:hypothetical protein